MLEERPRRSYQALASLGADALAVHLESVGLGAALRAGLREVVRLYREAEAAAGRLGELAKRRKTLHERQERATASLGPLGRAGEEGALRARLVTELGSLEDRLAELALEEERLRERRDDLERQALERLAGLGG